MEVARKGMSMGGLITIRQVTSMDTKLDVKERMKKRYGFKNYPSEFNYRSKCIVVFQNLDGVDVILFGLYVYEHDEKNPAPNNRTVYVSYLDSVYYMVPKEMRTIIYHEILISYLDHVRKKGFSTAHIWACPPMKGDDYILYAKPGDQKTPREERLRQWYIDMLVECQKRGVVGTISNMFDLYFADSKNDATVVPYMQGDYFPSEVESIIKDIEEGKNTKKNSSECKKKKSKSKSKSKSGRGGTRSTGLDEDNFAASGLTPPGYDQKSLEDGGQDYVMAKLGETIKPMKESFIVAFLAWDGAKAKHMVVPKEIEEYRKKHGIVVKLKGEEPEEVKVKEEICKSSSDQKDIEQEDEEKPNAITNALEKNDEKAPENVLSEKLTSDNKNKEKSTTSKSQEPSTGKNIPLNKSTNDSMKTETNVSTNAEVKSNPIEKLESVSSSSENKSIPARAASPFVRDGKFAAMAARKRNKDGEIKPEQAPSSSVVKSNPPSNLTVKDRHGRLVKVIDDDLEEMDCEFLNNRQAFLNLCQGNHYQFDQLRRAKHTSMMVLWHLHNRDAPKFVQQCAVCSREILTGFRFHCPTCADFDQCQECVNNPKVPKHPHPLKPIAVARVDKGELTETQRKERQRSIQLHMTLLLHAATCTSPECPSANCTKMKGLLKHGAICNTKAHGGCSVCKRIWALLQIHARQCKQPQCPVPNCMAIRERFRQLTKQQQAMDDRRRKEMNRQYRAARS